MGSRKNRKLPAVSERVLLVVGVANLLVNAIRTIHEVMPHLFEG